MTVCNMERRGREAPDHILPMWKELTIEDINVNSLIEYINTVFVENKQKERLIKYLDIIHD